MKGLPVRTALRVLLCSALLGSAALASDPEGFKAAKAEFDKVSRRHDDEGARNRREVVYGFLDYLDQKACRKFIAKAFDKEKSERVACAMVDVLGSCGVPEDLEDLFGTLGKIAASKGDPRCTVISLGRGLAITPPSLAEPATAAALKALPKSKGDLRLSLLEGIGALKSSTATAALRGFSTTDSAERFERNLALGFCGGESAVDDLARELTGPDPYGRRGAALGLAQIDTDAATLQMLSLLEADDPFLVEAAARRLGESKVEAAAEKLVAAFQGSPLRTRDAVRRALANIAGKDLGTEPGPWQAWLATRKDGGTDRQKPVESPLPDFFGTQVATDRVVILHDLSRSMDWKGRLGRAADGLAHFLESLPTDAEFALYGVQRTLIGFDEEGGVSSGAKRLEAATWVRKQLTGRGGFDLNLALTTALERHPFADTIVIATDSMPTGAFKTITYDEGSAETLAVFERTNRTRRVKVHVAFVVPGGRDEGGESDAGEFDDRIVQLRRLAEVSGGTLTVVDR